MGATRHRGGRLRKASRIAGRAVAALLLAALLAVAAGYAWLTSPAGGAWLASQILPRVNARISGTLDVRTLEVHGLSWDAVGLALRTPSGELVATAERLAGLPLLPLARGTIAIDGSRITGLDLAVDLLGGGVPLLDAVRPPTPGGSGGGPGGFRLSDLHVAGARIVVRQALAPALAARFVLHRVSGRVRHGREWSIALDGAIEAPLAGPVHAELTTSGAPGPRTLAFAVRGPGVAGAMRLAPGAPQGPRVELDGLALAPAAARAVWPAWPLAAPVEAAGRATRDATGWSFAAAVRGPAGAIDARGAFRPAARALPRIAIEVSALDVGRLLGRGPATRLSGAASGALAVAPGAPSGSVDATLSGAVAGVPVSTLALRASGGAGGVEVERVAVTLPGATAVGRGAIRAGRVRAAATMDVAQLASLASAAGIPARVAGRGRFHLAVRGPLAGPAVSVRGELSEAAVGPLRAGSVRLAAGLRLAPDLGGARLGALRVAVGNDLWRLTHPASIAWRGGVLRGGVLALASGPQRFAVRGVVGRDVISARASFERLRLETLSGVAGLPVLAGRASGMVEVTGLAADPRVSAAARVRGGPLPRLRGVVVSVRAVRRPGGAVRAEAEVSGRGARARARLETTDAIAGAPGAAPIRAQVRASGALATLAALAGVEVPATGDLAVRAQVAGSLGAPRVRARAVVRALAVRGVPAGTLRVEGEHAPGTTRVAASGRLLGGAMAAEAAITGSPGARAVSGTLRAENAGVGPLLALVPRVRSAAGRLDADLRISGDARAPVVNGRIALRDGAVRTAGIGSYEDVELRASAAAGEIVVEELAARSAEGHLLATLRGRAAEGALHLQGRARLRAFPLVSGWRLRGRVDGDLAIATTLAPRSLRGAVDVGGATVRLPVRVTGPVAQMAPPEDVHVVGEDRPVAAWRTAAPDAAPPAPDPAHAPVRIEIASSTPVRVHGPGLDAVALFARGFVLARDGRWGGYGTVRVPSGTVDILGSPVAFLGGSTIRFSGPLARPWLAVGLRGGFEPQAIVVVQGRPGSLQVGLAPPGAKEDAVFAALERNAPGGPGARMNIVGLTLPLRRLLEAPAGTSYAAGTPLTSRLRVATSGRIGADRRRGENVHAARVQVRVTPSVEAQVSAGDARSTSVDVGVARRRMPPRTRAE